MAEVYMQRDTVLDAYPDPTDYSLEPRRFAQLFARQYRHHCTNTINRYLWSYDNDFLGIWRTGSRYRVIGRVSLSDINVVKCQMDYDVYYESNDFDACKEYYLCLVSRLLSSVLPMVLC